MPYPTPAGILLGNTALLRLLLTGPAAPSDAEADGATAAAGGKQMSAWVAEWLRALSSGPLAEAAACVRPHVPALLGGLLQPAEGGSPGAEAWLRPLAEAVADAAEAAAGGGGEGSGDESSGGSGSDGDSENRDPNSRRRDGGAGKRGGKAAPAAGPLEVPPMVAYFIQAAKLKKVRGHGRRAHACAGALSLGNPGARCRSASTHGAR